jgi:hypothetical protein
MRHCYVPNRFKETETMCHCGADRERCNEINNAMKLHDAIEEFGKLYGMNFAEVCEVIADVQNDLKTGVIK